MGLPELKVEANIKQQISYSSKENGRKFKKDLGFQEKCVMLQIEHKLCIQRKLKGDSNELLCSYKVRFNTKREYKSNRGDAVCVYVAETKYAPRNPSFFLLALKEREEVMKNSQTLLLRKEKKW